MEYNHMQVGRLAEDDAKMFFYSLVRAVQHCHERHIAHRDISTHTIFVAPPRYEVKLSGFGRAVHCEPDTDTSGSTSCSVPIPPPPAAVTPNIVFVAPEVIAGDGRHSHTHTPVRATNLVCYVGSCKHV